MQPASASAVIPFPSDSCMALPEGTDEYRASIKSAIQFTDILPRKNRCVNGFFRKIRILSKLYRNPRFLWEKL